MPQPVSYNPGTPVSGSIQENNISYVVDGQNRNYRGGFGGLSWMSEVPAANNVIFIGNSVSLGRGPANIPLFYPAYNNSAANIIYAANTLPGSPRNFTTTSSAYNWAATNNFFINNSDNPIPRIDADGLVFYVDANQPTSYPQTGTSWYDMSGFGNNGTLTNGPTWNSNGWFGFDGADDFVNCGNGSSLNILRTVTMELWFNVSGFGSPWTNVFGKMNADGDSSTRCYTAFINSSGYVHFVTADTSGQEHLDSTNFINTGRWYHWIGTIDRNTGVLKQYVNSTLNTTGTVRTTDIVTNSDPLRIGYAGNYYERYNGLVSFGRIYSKALTQTEIKQNYFQSNIVQDGLVFMVDANNLVSYPKSGTSTYNLTGSQVGTLTNGVGFNSRNGGVFDFDGTDDTISIPYNTEMDPTGGITLEAWIYPEDLTTVVYQEIFRKENGTGRQLFSFQLNGTIISFGTDTTGNGYDELDIAITPSNYINRWCHFVATYTSGYKAIYVDGQLLGSNTGITGNLIQGNAAYFIGSTSGGSEFFNGYYASFKMYSRGLSASEVQQNYQATKDKFIGQNIVTNGLVAYVDATNKDSYPGTGTTWYDLSGNGNNFTFSSTPNVLNGLFNSGASVFAYRNAIPVDSSVNGYTLEACFKLNSSTGGGYQNITQNGGGDPTRHMMWYNGGSNSFLALFHTPNFYNNISDTLSLNTWYYLQLSYNPAGGGSNGRRAWLNGVEKIVNNTGVGNATPSGYFTISVDSDLVSNKSDTSYAFVRYYNRYLTEAEILQNYNATKTRFGL
jgi:hypothetical protein